MEDFEIIDLYWERNDKAISESVHKYGNLCRKIALNILHNHEDVEECLNDTWLGAWHAIPPHRPTKLLAFLLKITRNVSLNLVKSRCTAKRGNGQFTTVLDELQECIPSTSSVESEVEAAELEKAINMFLCKLPRQQCNIFLRRYWYVESIAEIADKYSVKQGAVKVSLSRTRRKLKSFLEKEGLL